jgi:hypothetical protein
VFPVKVTDGPIGPEVGGFLPNLVPALKHCRFLRAIPISDLAGNGNLFVAAEPGILFPSAPALP